MKKPLGHEEWLKRVERVIRAYRGNQGPPQTMTVQGISGVPVVVQIADPADAKISLDQAVKLLRDLGLAEGDAMQWLRSKSRR